MPARFLRLVPPAVMVMVMVLVAGCGTGASTAPDDGGTSANASGDTPANTPADADTTVALRTGVAADPEWYDADEMAAARDSVPAGAEWLAAWFPPEALEGVTTADLEVRYRPVTGLPADASAAERAATAFALLADPGPIDLDNPLEGVALRLLGAQTSEGPDGTVVTLDFDEGFEATADLGFDAAAARVQFLAMAGHSFPDADAVAVTVEGRGGAVLFEGETWDGPVLIGERPAEA